MTTSTDRSPFERAPFKPYHTILTMNFNAVFLVSGFFFSTNVEAFSRPTNLSLPVNTMRTTLQSLSAKKKKTTRRSTAGGAGTGFLKTKEAPKANDDYAIFPALEPHIMQTIIPAPEDWQEPGPLPAEVEDRLVQIYGFKNFNGLQRKGNENHQPETKSTALSLDSLLAINEDDNEEEDSAAEQTMREAIERLPPFTDFRILHIDPLVLAIDNFMTPEECQQYIDLADESAVHSQTSPTVGTGATARAQRTSTTWYHAYERVPALLTKACALLGLKNADGWEEVQTVRYRRQEHFSWHLDALDELSGGAAGQRIATLLVYLTDNVKGGATMFRDLNISVVPRQGSALLFFPAAGGVPGCPPDFRTLHCGQMVDSSSQQDKWIGQIWLRPRPYHVTVGTPHRDKIVAQAMAEYAALYDD